MNEIFKLFTSSFGTDPTYFIECGGRFEIIGNHTDHNHGLCLAASCNLSISGYVSKSKGTLIEFVSFDYGSFSLDISDVTYKIDENKSISMIRGVAKFLLDNGYSVGGFKLACHSTIFKGSGLSSSAAFEILIASIFNVLFNDNRIDKLTLCKAGQYSENNYYGKESGLLDQIGVCYGNIVSIDFFDINRPSIETFSFPFNQYRFVCVNTEKSHEGLNDLYSSIPKDMKNAAKKMGKQFLRECSFNDIEKCKSLSSIEFNRASHFFNENQRVVQSIKALKENNAQEFLKQINESRISSNENLHNMMIDEQYEGSLLQACDIAMKFMNNEGACKINGGGFAGSIICIVPNHLLDMFLLNMRKHYGIDNVQEIYINKKGISIEKL